MIHALRKEFTLAARNAARRFAPRRTHHRAATRVSWCPLALRWQRIQRHGTQSVMARATASAKQIWQPQIHLHIVKGAPDQTPRERSITTLRTITIHQTRVAQTSHWLSVRAAALTLPTYKLRPSERTAQLNQSTKLPKQHGMNTRTDAPSLSSRGLRQPERMELANKTARLPMRGRAETVVGDAALRPAPAVAARIVSPSFSPRVAQRFEVLYPRARRIEQAQESTPAVTQQGRMSPRRLALATASAPAPIDYVFLRASGRRRPALQFERAAEPPMQFQRAVELIWPLRQRDSTVAAAEFSPESVTTTSAPATRALSTRQLAQTLAATARAEAAAAPVTKLDPVLMDRLANDVIRRVEERLRIERERRGL